MRRILLPFIVIITLFLSSCSSGQNKPISPHEIAQSISNDTVALVAPDDDGFNVFCTGVWISQYKILTAQHCVEGLAKRINFENEDNEDFVPVKPQGLTVPFIFQKEVIDPGKSPSFIHYSRATVLSKKFDLALLEVKDPKYLPDHSVAKLADTSPLIGEQINVVGHTKGLYWSYITGVVSAYRRDMSGVGVDISGPFLQGSIPIYKGNSGGGVFNADGKLIGIASFIAPAPNVGFFIHLETIRGWLAGQQLATIKIDTDTDL